MRRAAKAGMVVAGAVAVGLAGTITLNATQTSSSSVAGAAPAATVNAASSAPGPASATATTPSATPSAPTPTVPAGEASPGSSPSSQTAVPAPASSAKPDAPVPAAPAPAPAAPAPAPAPPVPAQQGLDEAGIQRIKDSCTARLQSDADNSSIVTGTVVPRPFTVVSIAFSGSPLQSTAASGRASYDILMKVSLKLADGPATDSVRVCRVYDSDSHVDWLPAG